MVHVCKFPSCKDKMTRSTLCSFHGLPLDDRDLHTVIPAVTCCNHIFLTMWSWTFGPAGLALFFQLILWRWNRLQDDSVDKRCKSMCSYTAGITLIRVWQQQPTLQQNFSSSLVTRGEQWLQEDQQFLWGNRYYNFLPPFFIFPLSFVLSPPCVLQLK